jgi:hypothetical protein
MANLAFPQLSTGVQAQYPLRKRRVIQAPVNAFADGTMITSNINADSQYVWELAYVDLTSVDQSSLQDLFIASQGPFLPFIFIDPADNMLSGSTNLKAGTWIADPLLSVVPGAVDPVGGHTAFTLTNAGQTDQQVAQRITAPANFHYCLSVYASAPVPTSLALGRIAVTSLSRTFAVNSNWARLLHSAQLADDQVGFTISLSVPAGQTVVVFGPQLEPQLSPSRYRPTANAGGVFQNAHFLGDSITFESDAKGLFSTLITVETT